MTDVHRLWLLSALLVAGWLLWLLSPILTPFVVSALFAYLGDPLVDSLERAIRRMKLPQVSSAWTGYYDEEWGLVSVLPMLRRIWAELYPLSESEAALEAPSTNADPP